MAPFGPAPGGLSRRAPGGSPGHSGRAYSRRHASRDPGRVPASDLSGAGHALPHRAAYAVALPYALPHAGAHSLPYAGTPEPTPFTLVWMSDTQNISRNNPDVFDRLRDWILENREKENIQFVTHTGDVVDGMSPTMWENAANALVPIFETLPGMVVSGNHDVTKGGSQYYFNTQPYAKVVQKEGQTYEGMAAYVTFRACDTDFLVFGINYGVICTDWMNQVIAQHPDHIVIVVMHKCLQEDGRFYTEANYIFQDVMPKWPNFRLTGTAKRNDP